MYDLPLDFRGRHTYGFGDRRQYNFVRPSLENHEDMYGNEWRLRLVSARDAFPFGVLDRAIGISETVLKDKMI